MNDTNGTKFTLVEVYANMSERHSLGHGLEQSASMQTCLLYFHSSANRYDLNKLRKSLAVHINSSFLCKYFWCTAVLEKLVFRWIAPLLALRKQSIFLKSPHTFIFNMCFFLYISIYIFLLNCSTCSSQTQETKYFPNCHIYCRLLLLEKHLFVCWSVQISQRQVVLVCICISICICKRNLLCICISFYLYFHSNS